MISPMMELIGAIVGHILLGLDISLLSLSGMIAVAGVVVNDNLVLVDYINRFRQDGRPVASAIRDARAGAVSYSHGGVTGLWCYVRHCGQSRSGAR